MIASTNAARSIENTENAGPAGSSKSGALNPLPDACVLRIQAGPFQPKDPAEQDDVSKVNPRMVERLNRLFEGWRREMRNEATKQ